MLKPGLLSAGVLARNSVSRYWTPLIDSLSVANATPTEVHLACVKVFNSTLPDKSAFALAGKTISGIALDGTGKILILTVTVAYLYGDNIDLVYDKPATNPLMAGGGSFASFTALGTNSVSMIAAYLAVYNSLTTKPSAIRTLNQHAFLKTLVDNAVWSDIDSFRFLSQTVNSDNEALKDWKDVTKVATLHGTTAPVFTANVGFKMKKADARYIDLLWKPSDGVNYTLNNACIFFYRWDDNENEDAYDAGCYDGTRWTQVYRTETTLTGVSEGVVNGGVADRTIVHPIGMFVFNRINATHQQIFLAGVQQGADVADTAQVGLSTNSIWLGARHDPSATTSPSTRQYGLIGFGKALTSAKVTILNNAIVDYYANGGTRSNSYSAFIQTDFSDSNLATLRTTIRGRIWPGGYPSTGKDSITTGVAEPMASSATNLASIDQLSFTIAGIAARTPYVWHPTNSNGKFVIWHLDHFYNHTGTDIWESMGRADCIRDLINSGYTVCGIYMPPANDGTEGGGHSYPVVAAPYQTVTDLHYFLDTTIRVLNEYAGQFTAFYMAGHSGGAWATTMIASLDDRITKSFGNSGTLPRTAMIKNNKAEDWEQQLPGLTDLVDYGDLYAMGCTSGRKKEQNLNAYEDPALTGFNLETYQYAPYDVQMGIIAGSRFQLGWDTITTTHSVSASTRAKIISFFNS